MVGIRVRQSGGGGIRDRDVLSSIKACFFSCLHFLHGGLKKAN